MKPSRTPPFSLLSVIIPTLNEADALGRTLDSVARLRGPLEVLVVDGGSTDATVAVACQHGARVIEARRGRGAQLHAGATGALGDVLWFLHADTRPPAAALRRIAEALSDPAVVGGNFRVVFDSRRPAAGFLERLYALVRRFGLIYGDSALFVRRSAYERVGGFRPFPLFEDLDLVRRLRRRGRWGYLSSAVVTSARRFEGRSFARTFLRWVVLQVLYWLGFPPRTLGRFYTPIRGAPKSSGQSAEPYLSPQ